MLERPDIIIVGAGFAGMYMLHRLRGARLPGERHRSRQRRRRHLVLEPLPRRALRRREPEYCYSFSDELQQEWDWSERYAAAARDPALCQPRRRPVRPAPRHPASTPASTAAHFDETAEPLDGDHRSRRAPSARRSCIMATGCLSVPNLRRFRGPRELQGRDLPHRPLAARGRRFHRPAVGVIGTGSSAIQSIPLIAEQAASHRVPAHPELLDPRPERPARRRRRRR